MNATSLQMMLGLSGLDPSARTLAETALALAAALVALALRRRKLVVRAPAFLMISLGAVIDMMTQLVPGAPRLALSLEAIALVLFFFGAIRLALELIDAATRRGRVHFSTIFRDLVTVLLYGVVILIVLRATVGVDLAPLLATSAVVAAVIGLAMQESLGNIFSGLTLQLQKPFEPGDWVRFGVHIGRVQGIGWRSTRIVTRANERLEIPNSLLAKDVLTNYATGVVADEISVGLPYGEPPNRVKEVAMRVLGSIPEVRSEPPPEVFAWEYGDSAIRYRLKYWLADYGVAEKVRSEVTTSLWYALRRHSIVVPFPIRTLQIEQPPPEHELEAERAGALIDELRRVDFLSKLSDDQLRLITQTVKIHQFGRGEYLMREGEHGDTFQILRRGTVELLARGHNGAMVHVRDLTPPAYFGEISLMTGEPRMASLRAATDVEVLEINRQGFSQIFKARPEAAAEIGEIIAARMTETRQRVAAAHAPADQRSNRNWLLAQMRTIFDF